MRGEAELRIYNLKKTSPPQSRSQAFGCVSTPRMYPSSGYFLVIKYIHTSISTQGLKPFSFGVTVDTGQRKIPSPTEEQGSLFRLFVRHLWQVHLLDPAIILEFWNINNYFDFHLCLSINGAVVSYSFPFVYLKSSSKSCSHMKKCL